MSGEIPFAYRGQPFSSHLLGMKGCPRESKMLLSAYLFGKTILRFILVGASAEFLRLGPGREGKCAFCLHGVGLTMAPRSRGTSHSRPNVLEMSCL